jgi:Zn finger protein HypA/HybF involved in hydrogenase expression
MAAELLAGISALKSAFDLAKGLKDIDDATRRNSAVIELQEKILGAQSAQSTLVERVTALEAEVSRLRKWQVEKGKYRLVNVASGAFAYGNKPNDNDPEPPHWLCVNCYDNRQQRSMLQYQGRTPNKSDSIYACPVCKGGFEVPYTRNPESVAQKDKDAIANARSRRPTGDLCPKCRELEFRLERSEPHPIFGDMGGVNRYMKCDGCAFSEVLLVTPK